MTSANYRPVSRDASPYVASARRTSGGLGSGKESQRGGDAEAGREFLAGDGPAFACRGLRRVPEARHLTGVPIFPYWVVLNITFLVHER